ncbi:MAG: iron ABC transporter permease, partial [Eubacteriales bacterium]|nr:iron ABC transporter permease [Eubacteriales bacterium]
MSLSFKQTAAKERRQTGKKPAGVIALLAAVLFAAFLFSFSIGRYGVPVSEVVRIFLSRVFPLEQTWTAEMQTVVINIRLPRILIACLVGCALSSAGASYQGVFQNPMASPDILGASSGAAFGAALAILLGGSSRVITLAAFASSLVTVMAVYLIAQRAPGLKVVNLILAGIMVGSLFTAGTSYIKLVADPSNQLPAITYWMMGSLSGAKLKDMAFAFFPIAIGLIPLFCVRWQVNVLTLGDEEARTLGVNTNALRLAVILCATLATAASVSVSGMIGWVGLVIPHLCRKAVGSDYKYLIPASMIFGAAFLLMVDDVSRNLLATEIPIGILTAFIGAPFFLYLILRKEE